MAPFASGCALRSRKEWRIAQEIRTATDNARALLGQKRPGKGAADAAEAAASLSDALVTLTDQLGRDKATPGLCTARLQAEKQRLEPPLHGGRGGVQHLRDDQPFAHDERVVVERVKRVAGQTARLL